MRTGRAGRAVIDSLERRALMAANPIPLKVVGTPGGEFGPAFPAVIANNTDYFFAPGAGTLDLWKSTGAAPGTTLLRSFTDPGPGDVDKDGRGDHSVLMAVMRNFVFFTANNGKSGVELWRTDGTSKGTKLLKDINPGTTASSPLNFTVIGNRWLFFTADDGSHGRELWVTDGSAGGTRLLKDVTPGRTGSTLSNFGAAGFTLLFTASASGGTRLWRSDATDAGTFSFKTVTTFSSKGFGSLSSGAAVFAITDATAGLQLWSTKGTEGSTRLLKGIKPVPVGSTPTTPTAPSDWASLGHKTLFFSDSVDGKVAGPQLWTTDGSIFGTRQLTSVSGAKLAHMVVSGKYAYFFNGSTLWRSDGTDKGTKDIAPVSGAVTDLTPYNGHVFTTTTQSATGSVWRSDGSATGTARVTDSSGLFVTGYLAAMRSSLFFVADDGDTQALYSIPIGTPKVNLSPTISSYPTLVKAGSKANTLTLRLQNKGASKFDGRVPVEIYALTPGKAFDRTKLTPWHRQTLTLSLESKASSNVDVSFNVPASFPKGRYILAVLLDPNRTLSGEDVSDNLITTDVKKIGVS